MKLDPHSEMQFRRCGTPGYLLVTAGLLAVIRDSDGYRLDATGTLLGMFSGPVDLPPVAAALEEFVAAHALGFCGFLDDSSPSIQAVGKLVGLGMRQCEVGRLRPMFDRTAVAVRAEMERQRLLCR